ncbi:MAG: bifunctional diaminohydroxyphosphoribosylaminopyrimidine deaminase/5-amino-6-(5-phosphoribosylamino)uracil reductase RibD [bacterium]
MDEVDRKYMARALALAEMGRGTTSPNPMVGAVIVKGSRIIAEGYHEKSGSPHAEIAALRKIKSTTQTKGATLYVNLEPCTHHGRTPPCAPEIAKAGFRRVVIGMADPNPLVNGKGIRYLRSRDVRVTTGVLLNECRRLNEVYIKYITQKIPFVILKGACSLDGRIAGSTGASKWITCEASRTDAHRLRWETDAILVGIETALIDNPNLTCRLPGKTKHPYRIILDSKLRIPPDSHVVRRSKVDGKTIIATTTNASSRRAAKLEAAGCRLLRLRRDNHRRPSIKHLLMELGKMEISSVLVEGGGTVHASFLTAGAVDKFVIYYAPMLIGGEKTPGLIGGKGVALPENAPHLKITNIIRLGDDLRIEAYPIQ